MHMERELAKAMKKKKPGIDYMNGTFFSALFVEYHEAQDCRVIGTARRKTAFIGF